MTSIDVADLQLVARDVDAAAVHLDVAVVDELARGEHGGDELGAVDHGVETALEQADQVFAGVALHAAGFDIDAVELALGDVGVIALELLLGAQLHAEVGELALAALAVLAGAVFTRFTGLFGRPQMFWPIRRSILYFASLRFVIASSLSGLSLRKRALLCAGNFPEPTGPVPKA